MARDVPFGMPRSNHPFDPQLEYSMRSRISLPRCSTLVPAAALGLFAACAGGSDGSVAPVDGGATSLSVSFATAGTATVNAAGNAVIVGTAADTMVVTKVQMVLDNVKLRKSGVAACPDSMKVSSTRGRSSDDRGCSRLDLGPMLLDLPLGGTSTSPLTVTIPAGTYSQVEFELDDVNTGTRASQADKDFLTAHPEFRDVTVKVTGTYKGAAFTFLSRASAEVEFEFSPALVVQSGVNDNVTVKLDLAAWFKNASGAVLAPTVANQATIDQNITSSFSAFGDRDRDGREDGGRGESRGRRKGGNG
jgi:hypothetical protein